MSKQNKILKVGLIGYGYWGPNLLRNFHESDNAEVKWCAELRKERLTIVKKKYSSVKTTTEYEDILKDPSTDAIIIATPPNTHYDLAKKALLSGKHVWIEKPITETSIQAEELISLAKKQNKLLHVDHIFLYTEAVRIIKRLIDNGDIGKIYYFDSIRINLGLFQPDTNVIWDLAPHDISIMLYLLSEMPQAVSAYANAHVLSKIEDTAYLSFKFKSGVSVHIQIGWLSPVKVRKTIIAGSKKMVIYDDLEVSEKIKIYDKGLTLGKAKPISTTSGYHYRTGDMNAPAIANVEALQTQCKGFLDAIRSGRQTLSTGEDGLKVVKILEAAMQSLKEGSRFVEID